MRDFGALVGVHGYNPEGMEGGRDPLEVWDDRLETGYETASTLDSWGADVAVALSGGGNYDGQTEAEIMFEYAQEKHSPLTQYEVFLEQDSEDTAGNVEKLHDITERSRVDALFLVTSSDHAPRALRDAQSYFEETESDIMIAGVGSDETYAESGEEPFIVEAAAFKPFVDAFNNVWGVDPENYEEAAEEVAETLQKFH